MRISLLAWFSFILYNYWLCLTINISLVSSLCLEDQKFLLLQFKNELKFDSTISSKLVLWNQSLPCCEWNGVTCDEEGYVTGLDLSEKLIYGGFGNSSTLFSLHYLQNLNLAFNNFGSVIPSGIKNLKNLTCLNLSNAGFVEQIPMEISQLTRLAILDISTYYYLGVQTLKLENPNLVKLVQNLAEVRELYLDGTNISLEGKEWCRALSTSLPHLQVLSMSMCNLSGPIDSSLENLQNLSIIRLHLNNLSAPVPEFFAYFSNLTTLDLGSCGLIGTFPKEIFQVQSLSSLDLSFNSGLQGSFSSFPKNGSLQELILSKTNFSGALPDSISNLKQLSRLEISQCNLNGILPDSMSNLKELTYLDLSFNNFTGPIPPFDMMMKITLIDLSHNKLSGGISSALLKGLAKLVSINLQGNVLSGSIPSSLFSLPLLQTIDLSNNHFQGQLDGISNVSSSMLETLDLSSNNLEGPIPEFIFHLTKLKFLQLSSNKFNGTIHLDMILRLENLMTLDLSNNNFSIDENINDVHLLSFPKMTNVMLASCKLRQFPGFLRNQSQLGNLDLSNNQISGTIPNWIWQLNFLSQLNLSHNSLTEIEGLPHNLSSGLNILDLHDNKLQGSLPTFPKYATYLDYSSNDFMSAIPFDVGNYLSVTIFLSLNNNKLYGSIPHSLCNAPNLLVLDLSNNKLEGTIPNCLTSSETLGVLSLQNNLLNGSIPDSFPKRCALQTLDLHGNQIGGLIPSSLANCMALQVLNLGNNQINDLYPCLLKKISTLRVMVLRRNKFQGPIGCPHSPGFWPVLQIVDLAFNNFNGSLPGKCFTTWKAMMLDEDQVVSESNHIRFQVLKFGQVYYQDSVTVTSKGLEMEFVTFPKYATYLDYSSNHFMSAIPFDVSNYLSVTIFLSLNNNKLYGSIPHSLCNAPNLLVLDLSNNKLEGTIPNCLTSSETLGVLSLQNNMLNGSIPDTFPKTCALETLDLHGNQIASSKKCSDHGRDSSVVYKDSGVEFDWQFVFAGVGFGVGSGMAVAALMFWDTGRKWSNNSIDKILLIILPMMGLAYTPMCKEEEESDTEENHDHYNAADCYFDYLNFRGEYCVFCTKLDISMKKAIHDPRCTCHHSPSISTSTSSSESDSP
ncbi:receptor-like protein 7 [Senna tora]|uniref:Receptor-like protein 7 n=1 Tax=Senna tora TaxID=362788 RepID=A0A834WLQ9_9FABA|nr:receptor-like protein 7 [Senna tora]